MLPPFFFSATWALDKSISRIQKKKTERTDVSISRTASRQSRLLSKEESSLFSACVQRSTQQRHHHHLKSIYICQMSVDFLCSVIRRQLIELNAKQAEEFNITNRYSVCMFALWLTYTPVERHRLRVGVSRQYDIFGVLIRKRGADAIWWEKRVHKWAKEKLLEYKWNIVICNSSNVRNFIVAARCVTPYAWWLQQHCDMLPQQPHRTCDAVLRTNVEKKNCWSNHITVRQCPPNICASCMNETISTRTSDESTIHTGATERNEILHSCCKYIV